MRAGHVHGAVAALTSAAFVCLAIASFAQSPVDAEPEPIAVSYRAPEGCPDDASFLREITARTQRARAARADERARIMRVTISNAEGGYAGRFWIQDERGAS